MPHPGGQVIGRTFIQGAFSHLLNATSRFSFDRGRGYCLAHNRQLPPPSISVTFGDDFSSFRMIFLRDGMSAFDRLHDV